MIICDCNLTCGCYKCKSFFISYPMPQQQAKTVIVLVTKKELNKHDYDWLHCDNPPDPIKVKGILI